MHDIFDTKGWVNLRIKGVQKFLSPSDVFIKNW